MMSKVITINNTEERNGDCYPEFGLSIRTHFNSIVSQGVPLFTTDTEGLFEAFLSNLPDEARQHYTCNACRNFVNRFGGLVTISDNGETKSAFWNEKDVPAFFAKSVKAMKNIVLKSKVNGIFLSSDKVLGQPITGEWQHMSAVLPNAMVYGSRLITANQAMAEKREDFRILIAGLLEYPDHVVDQAVTLLKTESLYRSEKCLGVAEWLLGLHVKRANTKNSKLKNNIVWLAVGSAPTGYCHVKSSMIGTLLDDIAEGMSFDDVSRRFASKMHPLQYQRPQAAPTAGNIQQAEKIVEKLGIKRSLERRFARIEELKKVWIPKEKEEQIKGDGVFSHLMAKDSKELPKMDIPPITMTWEKFSKTVLPFAEEIEFLVKSGSDNFSAILTAVHEDSPPILQWDNEEQRNPFSWYVYNGGSTYSRWGLSTGCCKVTGVCLQPSMWYGDFPHQSKSVYFILDGARDSGYKHGGGGRGNLLFPEILKSELREIRSTIEAYSKNATIEGYDDASACGIRLQHGSNFNATFRVKTDTGMVVYKLDRWD